MRALLFPIPLLLSSAACSDAESFAEGAGVEARASTTASSETPAGKARSIAASTEAYEFEYSYPAQVGAYPVLRAYLDADLEKSQSALVAEATEAKKGAEAEGYPFNAHSSTTTWKVVADLPNWLSLSRDISVYSGGAHGMYGTDGLLFDKRAKALRQPLDLFRSPAELQSALESRWCAALDEAREDRRGVPVDKNDETFGGCPSIGELTVLLGSSNGKRFDRIGLFAGPYVAGPYSEGEYEVTLNVDDDVIAAVKPEYAKDFAVTEN